MNICAWKRPKIEKGLLGLTVLCELMNWNELKTFYGFDRSLIYKQSGDGWKSGDMSWFVRWATDHLLDFKISGTAAGKITDEAWAERMWAGLEPLSSEMRRVTIDDERKRLDKGVRDRATKRFNDLFGLLEHSLSGIQQFLESHDSYLGVAELIETTNETDIACMLTVPNLRKIYSDMHTNQGHPHHVCFEAVSNLVLERLKEWKQPVRVERALRTMLKVLPKLDIASLDQLGVDNFGFILNNYGLESEATELANNMIERRAASVDVEPWKDIPSPDINGSQHPEFYNLRTISYVPNRDNRRRIPIESEWEELDIRTWSDLDKYLPIGGDEGDADVFRQRHENDSDSESDSEGEIILRPRNYRNLLQRSTEGDESGDGVFRQRHDDDLESDSEGEIVVYPRNYPNKKQRHNDDEDAQVAEDKENTVPVARSEDRYDGNGALQNPVLLADDNESLIPAEESEPHDAPVASVLSKLCNLLAVPRLSSHTKGGEKVAKFAQQGGEEGEEHDAPTSETPQQDAPIEQSADHDATTETNRVPIPTPHPHHLPSKPSFQSKETPRSTAWKFGHPLLTTTALLGASTPPAPLRPTTWRDHYNEYMALPRDLELEHSTLPLRIGNHAREALLRDMATAEAEGTVLGAEQDLCEERRRAVYEDMEVDLWTIKMVVGSARIFGGRGRTLRELIDLEDEDEGFDDVFGA
jgi:hypothetical protein